MVQTSLDAIFTALTCLSSSDYGFNPVYINSRTPVHAENFSMSCQLQAFEIINEKIQRHQEQITQLHNEVLQLQGILRNQGNSTNILPSSCENQGNGLTRIKVNVNIDPFYVLCDQTVLNGNWLIFAQRYDGTTDFYRTWDDYKMGFGNLDGEFFLGLDKLHAITNGEIQELLIIMENVQKEERTAHYAQFSIGNEAEKYKINVLGKYDGDAGDAMRYHAGSKFSTFDNDNDRHPQNCARIHAGAWWYSDCMEANLFGTFQRFGEPDMRDFKGILWKRFEDGPKGSLKKIKMLLRPNRT